MESFCTADVLIGYPGTDEMFSSGKINLVLRRFLRFIIMPSSGSWSFLRVGNSPLKAAQR